MAIDNQELTVQAVSFFQGRGPVFYASLPRDTEKTRHRLAATLWGHLVVESPRWQRCQVSNGDAVPLQVSCGPLGKPCLLVGGHPGPAISFSEGGGRVWAALSGDDSDIGIDVAGADEFHGEYPLHRVFHQEELHHALRLTDGDSAGAAALLWSVKEAVVKALGCGFHLVDPRQITVHPSATDCGGHSFQVGLSGKALERFPPALGSSLRVHSLPKRDMWISLALFNRRAAVHG